eukprot:scaffold40880_cov53-Attheya_sp.AAC.2
MSTSLETRNLIFVGRCLAVAVNTGEMEALKADPNFTSVLSALEAWTKTKIERKSTFSQTKMTVSRNTVNLMDPRGFSLSLNNHLIENLYKISKIATVHFDMQEAGWEVPDQIKSLKNPPKLKMSSTSLADFKGNLADVPDGNEIISVKEQADNKDEVFSSDEKEVVSNESESSSDDDSAPKLAHKLDSQKLLRPPPSRQIQVLTRDTASVSSNSDSDSDNRSDKKPRAKRE